MMVRWTGTEDATDQPETRTYDQGGRNSFCKKAKNKTVKEDMTLEEVQTVIGTGAMEVQSSTHASRNAAMRVTPQAAEHLTRTAGPCEDAVITNVYRRHAKMAARSHNVQSIRCRKEFRRRRIPLKNRIEVLEGSSTEDREEWTKELDRHCRAICDDRRPTRCIAEGGRTQKERCAGYRKVYGMPEIAAGLVMHARSCMSKDKALGLEDIIVSEMVTELPTQIFNVITDSCRARFRGSCDVQS